MLQQPRRPFVSSVAALSPIAAALVAYAPPAHADHISWDYPPQGSSQLTDTDQVCNGFYHDWYTLNGPSLNWSRQGPNEPMAAATSSASGDDEPHASWRYCLKWTWNTQSTEINYAETYLAYEDYNGHIMSGFYDYKIWVPCSVAGSTSAKYQRWPAGTTGPHEDFVVNYALACWANGGQSLTKKINDGDDWWAQLTGKVRVPDVTGEPSASARVIADYQFYYALNRH